MFWLKSTLYCFNWPGPFISLLNVHVCLSDIIFFSFSLVTVLCDLEVTN